MARDVKQLHPELQKKIKELKTLCKKKGIDIGIGECFRTVAEQNALYAKGRTKPGPKVTNAKGSTYSSQHQWGIAVDFYLLEDVDKDGKISDDAFNNRTGLFDKVGAIAKSIGLGWGGDWTSPVDKPHLYLPQWGSTTLKLKSTYGTFAAFKKTWNKSSSTKTTKSKSTKEVYNVREIKKGSRGKAVKIWQIIIGLTPNGTFGPKTEEVTKAWQKKHKLEADGIVGKNTWKVALDKL